MSELSDKLRSAVNGLHYPSDSDEPFTVIIWPGAGAALAAVEANTQRRPIEQVDVAAFFGELSTDPQCPRFAVLRGLLEGSLTRVGVFRVGEGSEIDVYLVGRVRDGQWVGVKTKSVET